jgi:sigma-B regulation protein RsbU (phosphoserine phosphatase)
LLDIALYEDSLSAPFARLRRNTLVSAAAALTLLASIGIITLRFGSYVRGKQLETQMEIARQVQSNLLPPLEAFPPEVDLAALCLPASLVGGDFYDVVRLTAGRVAFLVGDVSGHGMPAALLMGLLHGAMSSMPWGISDEPPERGAERLNLLLLAKSSGERFASLAWCAYDPEVRVLRYLNAGHPPPLRFRPTASGAVEVDRLKEGGPVLGLLVDAVYRTVAVEAEPGETVALFSDGLVDAIDSRGEDFGEERLIRAIRRRLDLPARAICDAVFAELHEFTGRRPADDDQTLLVVRLWPAPPSGEVFS